ncbi:hypothetical protein BKA62DRAFT_734513 [Auriculariales sp. MPI-PUGE-AT-0066]|nr:hypothetical protein BKA62DRAFT_734513 [Auriculariales sp. MPI-PUGE-AT-0066]
MPQQTHAQVLSPACSRTLINGGLAGMIATACIQPSTCELLLRSVKVRIQLSGGKASPLGVARDIIASGPGLMRQASFIGLANTRAKEQDRPLTFSEREPLSCRWWSCRRTWRGCITTCVSGCRAHRYHQNPADLALIRMQASDPCHHSFTCPVCMLV